MKKEGTKSEILPALIAAEQQGIFKRGAVIPYFLKKAAWTSDRPFDNTDWGSAPKSKRPDNALNYRALQQEAKALGIGKRCLGLKGPDLAEEIRKEKHERSQSESGTARLSGHEGVSGEDGQVGDQAEDWTSDRVGEVSPEVER